VVKYGYDGVAPTGCTPPSLTFTNAVGRRTQMCDAAGGEAWTYDALGRVLTDRRVTNSVTKDFSYQYYETGAVWKLTYPTGRTIEYHATPGGNIEWGKDVANNINYALGASYNAGGALEAVTLGQTATFTGINLNQSFNPRGQPTTIRAWSTNGVALDLAYCFNVNMDLVTGNCAAAPVVNDGNVVQIKNNLNTARTQNFTYDELNRIKTAMSQATTGTYAWGLQFGYDIWANLLSATVTQGSAPMLNVSVGTTNRISGFCYDAAGNLQAESASPCPSPAYTYDAENRMKSALNVNYTYDGDGKRVQKSNGKLYWYGGGSEVLNESDLGGTISDEYVFFGGTRIARRKISSGEINFYFADHLGTSRVVTNATGTPLDDSDFYPFGGERAVLSSSGNAYKFTGKERDSESGLDYFGARYYAAGYGRFTTTDPIWIKLDRLIDAQRLNLYSYVRNSPLRFVDPSGNDLQLGDCSEGPQTVCFRLLQEGLSPEDRSSVSLVEGDGENGCAQGLTCVLVDPNHESSSKNFQALQKTANDHSEVAVLNIIGPTKELQAFGIRRVEQGRPIRGTFEMSLGQQNDDVRLGGITLFPFTGNNTSAIVYSPTGVTQIYVNDDFPDIEITVAIHHELRHVFLADFGRALPKGQHGQSGVNKETGQAEKEARANARKN